jgi:replicative DNA helicase
VNLPYYASIVVEKAKYRELIYGANRIIADAYEAELNADEAIDRAEALMMDIGRSAARSEFVLADDWVRELYTVIGHAIETKRVVTGVPTSLSKLDRYTRGLQPSDLILLAARPSVGKTAMALQMALYAAEHAMTGFVSLEMSRRMVGLRAVALEGRVDAFKLMTGFLSDNEQGRVAHAMERIASKRLAIDDASGLTASQLRAKVRRLKARYGLGIVFIDYLQLVRLGEKSENRNLELSAISASLKDLAKDLDIPVVVLSQLSRDAARTNRRPALHDLRDSGALEQDADLVMLIHRPNQGDDAKRMDDGEDVEIIIAKQRNGPVGVVKLHWIAEQMRFGEATESPEQDRML